MEAYKAVLEQYVADYMQDPANFLTSFGVKEVACKTALSFTAMMAIFIFLRILVPRSVPRELRVSWALKGTSLVHSLVVAPAAIWALACEPDMAEVTLAVIRLDAAAAAGPLNHALSQVAPAIVPITLGYFIFDLLLLPWWEGAWKGWIPMILHHVLSLMTWPVGLVEPACHPYLLLCVSMEASSPFVQLRWFISQHHGKNTWLYVLNGALMTLGFFACRIVVLPYYLWAIYVSAPHSEASGLALHVRRAASILFLPNVLNAFWFYLMIKGIFKMRSKGERHLPKYSPTRNGSDKKVI